MFKYENRPPPKCPTKGKRKSAQLIDLGVGECRTKGLRKEGKMILPEERSWYEKSEEAMLYISQKRAMYAALVTIYIGFMVCQLLRLEWVRNSVLPLSEVLYGLFYLLVFTVPFLLINYWTLFVKYRKHGRKKRRNGLSKWKVVMVIASLIGISGVFIYQTGDVTTYGVNQVEHKIHEKKRYYIVVADYKLSVTSNEYQLIEKGQSYAIKFHWNRYTPSRGDVRTIESLE